MPRFHATIIMLLLCLVTRVQRCTSFSTSNIQRQAARTTTTMSLPASSRRTYLDSLNEAQIEAVTQPLEGITRVVAGPGAGKTRVLTCRIAHLLNDDDRDRILAVTFTKKASGEMQERLKGLLDTQQESGQDPGDEILISDNGLVEESSIALSSGLERVTLGTFHSICAKILRWNGKQLASLPSVYRDMVGSRNNTNLDASFAILDQGDQLRIVKEKLKMVGIDLQREKDLKAQQILNNFGKIKSKVALDPKELRKNRALAVANEIYPLYREHMFASNALDFDDLIYMTRELLQANETVRDSLRRRWPHVLVDEFQDTSEVQLDLVKLWTSDSLLVVGDADQSIYSWRGAHVESMSDFGGAFPKVHTVYLMENYRSTTNIVRAAQRVISESDSNSAATLRQDMKPMRGKGPSPRVLACANGKAEASYVVKSIQGMIEQKEINPDQTVAILYRTNAQSRALEEACVQNNLPYVVRGAAGTFYSRAEIKDCLCFLRWLHNGRDESAMLRAFKTPTKGLGEKAVQDFQKYCREVHEVYAEQGVEENRPTPLDLLIAMSDNRVSIIPEAPTAEVLIPKRSINKFKAFSMQMGTLRQRAYSESVSDLISSIIETLGIENHLNAISKSNDEFADRWSNVQELRQAAERYTKGGAALSTPEQEDAVEDLEEAPLLKFLDDVALVTEMAKEDDDPSKKVIKANLMTIHASKGSEFDVVFLVGNEDGTFPTNRAIQEGEGSVALDEERRLCYVAMTRAKNNLIMTWRREVSFFQGDSFRTGDRERSRFLDVLVAKKPKAGGTTQVAAARSNPEMRFRDGMRSPAAKPSPPRPREGAKRDFSSPARRPQTTARPLTRRNLDLSNLNSEVSRVARKSVGVGGELKAILGPKPPIPQKRPNVRSQRSVAPTQSGPPRPRPRVVKKVVAKKPEKEPDSTWFFPVGSSVVHLQHGAGTVLPPPPNSPEGEMMVRVKFQAGKQVDLPAMGKDLFPN